VYNIDLRKSEENKSYDRVCIVC